MLVCCRGMGLITIGTLRNFIEHRSSMTARSLMDILSWKLFYICIAKLTGRPASLPKFIIIVSPSNVVKFNIHVVNEAWHIFEDERPTLMRCDKLIPILSLMLLALGRLSAMMSK